MAVQAQSAFRRELGPEEANVDLVRPDNWDSLRSGLLSADLLQQQLRALDAAFLSANERELEVTKHLSLFQLAPTELLRLRQTGTCTFSVPEFAFDTDFPAQYYRRIKAVRVSIPCVVGPYTTVNATLRLVESHTRRGTDRSDEAQPELDVIRPAQTAIAVSGANQEGGVFELDFRDARYLPFEGAGAVSTWELTLPSTLRPFDYATMSDVVLHLNYTARDAGMGFAQEVTTGMSAALEHTPMSRLFSLRQDHSNAWNQLFTVVDGQPRTCTLQLSKSHFPAFLDYTWETAEDQTISPQPLTLKVAQVTGYLRPKGVAPDYAGHVLMNGQPSTDLGLSMPSYDLTNAAGTLSSTQIGNGEVVDCVLTIDDLADMDDWGDLYLSVDYTVQV